MSAAPTPQFEWVPGPRNWWVLRGVGPAICAGTGVVALGLSVWMDSQALSCGCNFHPAAMIPLQVTALVSIALLLLLIGLNYALPSVRRIGIASTGLVIDLGLAKRAYSWAQVSSLTPKRITFLMGPSFRLSPSQADRLLRLYQLR